VARRSQLLVEARQLWAQTERDGYTLAPGLASLEVDDQLLGYLHSQVHGALISLFAGSREGREAWLRHGRPFLRFALPSLDDAVVILDGEDWQHFVRLREIARLVIEATE
jgi:hypothetical protein